MERERSVRTMWACSKIHTKSCSENLSYQIILKVLAG